MDEAYERRAEERRRTMTVAVTRSPEAAAAIGAANDLALEPHRRAELIWPLVCEPARIQVVDASELRFDRSAARVEWRKR
jgi:hypothetical protein